MDADDRLGKWMRLAKEGVKSEFRNSRFRAKKELGVCFSLMGGRFPSGLR
jgi:hypothetical protein